MKYSAISIITVDVLITILFIVLTNCLLVVMECSCLLCGN